MQMMVTGGGLEQMAKKKSLPRVYLYGLDETYRIVHFYFIPSGEATVKAIRATGTTLRQEYPNIQHVYAIDNHPSLYKLFQETKKKPSVENCVMFKLMLEQYGMEIKK